MLTGVTSSPLLSNLLEGKKQTVPVGQVPLTNMFEQNDPGVYPTSVGSELTSRDISDFEAYGDDIQFKALHRDEATNNITFESASVVNAGKIVDIGFNAENGVLSIIKADGSIVAVDSFLTQADFGQGAVGKQGLPGLDGDDGEDGDDGDEGDTGCVGNQGTQGELGIQGATAPDGVQGPIGQIGQTGLVGLQGPVGEQGRFGHEGARGRKGLSCNTDSQGSSGTPGVTPNSSFVISAAAPTDSSLLWGKPA